MNTRTCAHTLRPEKPQESSDLPTFQMGTPSSPWLEHLNPRQMGFDIKRAGTSDSGMVTQEQCLKLPSWVWPRLCLTGWHPHRAAPVLSPEHSRPFCGHTPRPPYLSAQEEADTHGGPLRSCSRCGQQSLVGPDPVLSSPNHSCPLCLRAAERGGGGGLCCVDN